MNFKKASWLFIIIVILIHTEILDAAAQHNNDNILINDGNIYLSTGETWIFYQGYSLTLMNVNNIGNKGWVQIKLNDTLIRSDTVSQGEILYLNRTMNNTNETVILSLEVSGIYSGEHTHIIAFSQVYQYYNPALCDPTPIPTYHPDDSNNISNTFTPAQTGGSSIIVFKIFFIIVIICLCSILVRRKLQDF